MKLYPAIVFFPFFFCTALAIARAGSPTTSIHERRMAALKASFVFDYRTGYVAVGSEEPDSELPGVFPEIRRHHADVCNA